MIRHSDGTPATIRWTDGRLAFGPTPDTPVVTYRAVTDRGSASTGAVHTTSDGTTSATYRTPHQVRGTGINPRVAWENVSYLDARITPGANPVTLKAALEVNGTIHPLTWDGQDTVTIAGGATVITDPATDVTLTPGETIYVRTYVTVANPGDQWPLDSYDVLDNGGGVAWGEDLAHTGVIPEAPLPAWGTGTRAWFPLGIFAESDTVTPVLMLAGSSSTAGWGDRYRHDAANTGGYGVRAADLAGIPYVHTANGGDSYGKRTDAINAMHHPPIATRSVTHVIGNMGANDWQSTRPLLVMQRDAIRYWSWWRTQGLRYWQVLPNPHPSSSDGYQTVEGQTVHAQNWRRAEFCDWVRDGAPMNGTEPVMDGSSAVRIGDEAHPLAGYIDFPAMIETEVNSGIWRVDLFDTPLTGDGLHFNPVTHDLLARRLLDDLGIAPR